MSTEPKFPPDLRPLNALAEIWSIQSSDSREWVGFSEPEAHAMAAAPELHGVLDGPELERLMELIAVEGSSEMLAAATRFISVRAAALAKASGETVTAPSQTFPSSASRYGGK